MCSGTHIGKGFILSTNHSQPSYAQSVYGYSTPIKFIASHPDSDLAIYKMDCDVDSNKEYCNDNGALISLTNVQENLPVYSIGQLCGHGYAFLTKGKILPRNTFEYLNLNVIKNEFFNGRFTTHFIENFIYPLLNNLREKAVFYLKNFELAHSLESMPGSSGAGLFSKDALIGVIDGGTCPENFLPCYALGYHKTCEAFTESLSDYVVNKGNYYLCNKGILNKELKACSDLESKSIFRRALISIQSTFHGMFDNSILEPLFVKSDRIFKSTAIGVEAIIELIELTQKTLEGKKLNPTIVDSDLTRLPFSKFILTDTYRQSFLSDRSRFPFSASENLKTTA